jgi:hypothetical protein
VYVGRKHESPRCWRSERAVHNQRAPFPNYRKETLRRENTGKPAEYSRLSLGDIHGQEVYPYHPIEWCGPPTEPTPQALCCMVRGCLHAPRAQVNLLNSLIKDMECFSRAVLVLLCKRSTSSGAHAGVMGTDLMWASHCGQDPPNFEKLAMEYQC